mmetsp:Transcript_45535/g.33292  ORF Transcript_45535/g.33292 Transcript_45535/m.33292 type:complete len:116 (-) Transcript_45535:1245-1592(-)
MQHPKEVFKRKEQVGVFKEKDLIEQMAEEEKKQNPFSPAKNTFSTPGQSPNTKRQNRKSEALGASRSTQGSSLQQSANSRQNRLSMGGQNSSEESSKYVNELEDIIIFLNKETVI